MSFSGKKYKLQSSDKFDEYMKALGNIISSAFLSLKVVFF